MKQQIHITQPHVGAFRYRIVEEGKEDRSSKLNYGAWQSAFDAAIERINTARKISRGKKKRLRSWQ